MVDGRSAKLVGSGSSSRRAWREEPEEGLPSYYLTLADMMTLLFSFFVALVAFVSWSEEARRAAASSIRSSLPVLAGTASGGREQQATPGQAPPRDPGHPGTPGPEAPAYPPGGPGAPAPTASSGEEGASRTAGGSSLGEPGRLPAGEEGLIEEVRRRLGTPAGGGVEVLPRQEGVLIRVSSSLLFPSGSDDLLPEGRRLLRDIGAVVRDVPSLVRVEGHTDDVPIQTARFPSNWELSAGRAVRVVRILTEEEGVDPRRVFFAGYGECRPVAANVSDANRQRNRRVEIYLLSGRP